MTRARTTRTGPGRRPSLPRSAVLSLMALVVVIGCGPAATATDRPVPASPNPSAAASTSPSGPPVAPTPTEPPDSLPPVPETPTPTAPASTPGPAIACTGDVEQQDFFAAVADAVDWDVFCPVLQAGWLVDAGNYRLADGGRLQIAYGGPGDARLELWEGAFCDEDDGCVPGGTDAGAASFGPLQGVLVEGADGSFSVVVDRGAPVSWLLTGTGLDRETLVSVAAGLVLVGR